MMQLKVERERTESIAGSDFSVVSKVQNYKLCVQGKPICPAQSSKKEKKEESSKDQRVGHL